MDGNRNEIKENVDKKQEIEYQDSSATIWCANTSFGDNRQKKSTNYFYEKLW
jgi:hypothetical protein